ncbi:acyltransferase family protein [Sphingobacterium corticibacterium]|uniref:Acyltransferase n=1 Tax=Sphingobacterium corticibacterium TaxID=2484746 RepID=A0A4Q6XG73_9SPHI|nr:acyltransferase [Sphingobacterium corticibacterium]RZF58890.1 acyltransferase [Sphingobacterium corticibacterium]
MQSNAANKEIRSLTGIRGLAALIVAIHHFISKYYIDYFEKQASDSLLGYMRFNYANHGYLMVELFFILSGFVLALSYDKRFGNAVTNLDYKRFMIKRFNRVYPLYFFSTIIYFFVFNLDKINRPEILVANLLFFELWLPKSFTLNNVSWSLCTEWFLYIIFPFILISTKHFREKPVFLILLATVIFILAPILNTQKLYDQHVNYSMLELRMSNGTGAFLRCLGSYIVGLAIYYVYIYRKEYVKLSGKYWYIIIGCILIFYGIDRSDILLNILFGLLILALTQSNKLSDFFGSRILYFLGMISYSIYLNHMIFLRILNFSFKKDMWIENEFNVFIGLLLFLLMTILSSWVSFRLVEAPFNSWLNKRIAK